MVKPEVTQVFLTLKFMNFPFLPSSPGSFFQKRNTTVYQQELVTCVLAQWWREVFTTLLHTVIL